MSGIGGVRSSGWGALRPEGDDESGLSGAADHASEALSSVRGTAADIGEAVVAGAAALGTLPSRVDAFASMGARWAASATAAEGDRGKRTVREWSDADGAHHEVRGPAADGGTVSARTTVKDDGVTSEVELKRPDGSREVWTFDDRYGGDDHDLATARSYDAAGNEIETRCVTPRDFLAFAGRAARVETPGVDFKDPLGATYSAAYTSSSLVASGTGPGGEPVHVVASLGVHQAFPFPGNHWDEGQIAILDADYQPTLTLRMPKDLEASHLNVKFRDTKDPVTGEAMKLITYDGYMEDDDGRLRYVEAEFQLHSAKIEKQNPSLWDSLTSAVNGLIGFDQNARVVSELQGQAPQTLKVDGEKVLDIEKTMGAVDDKARFNLLVNNRHAAINYAPPGAPLLSLIDPKENEARYFYDATLLDDTSGLISRLIPSVVRKGLLAAHYVTDAAGRRRDVSEKVTPDGPPLSSKSYVWKSNGRPAAILTRELVRYRDADGNVELGFRETIRKI